jgi:hypothetical protein
VTISRKLVKQYSSKKLIGSSRTETKQYEITVRNTKKVAVTVTIQDQVPVSTNKEIEVDDARAQDAQLDKDSGIATWNILLESAQERKLQIGYKIKYPRDRKIILD